MLLLIALALCNALNTPLHRTSTTVGLRRGDNDTGHSDEGANSDEGDDSGGSEGEEEEEEEIILCHISGKAFNTTQCECNQQKLENYQEKMFVNPVEHPDSGYGVFYWASLSFYLLFWLVAIGSSVYQWRHGKLDVELEQGDMLDVAADISQADYQRSHHKVSNWMSHFLTRSVPPFCVLMHSVTPFCVRMRRVISVIWLQAQQALAEYPQQCLQHLHRHHVLLSHQIFDFGYLLCCRKQIRGGRGGMQWNQ